MTEFPDAPRVALDPEGSVADGLEIAALRDEVARLEDQIASLTARAEGAEAERDEARRAFERAVDDQEMDDAREASEVAALRAEVERLRGAVEELAGCVRHYRDMYQRHGGDALDTGRAWDLMRRAEHAALAALSPAPEGERRHAVSEHGDCASWCDVCRAEARERDATPSPEKASET